jgi:hypothetical protein
MIGKMFGHSTFVLNLNAAHQPPRLPKGRTASGGIDKIALWSETACRPPIVGFRGVTPGACGHFFEAIAAPEGTMTSNKPKVKQWSLKITKADGTIEQTRYPENFVMTRIINTAERDFRAGKIKTFELAMVEEVIN